MCQDLASLKNSFMLTIDHLTRTFGDLTAVDDVSFSVPAGTTIGFVGGNGAGKTTTMRMIMGLLTPTSGQVLWNDRPITAEDRRQFGYMPEERGLYPKEAVIDQLIYLAQLHGASKAAARSEATDLLERFGLGDRLKEKLEKLSLGNQQRVQIAASVMCSPIALVLDEPFSGLDPDAVDSLAEVLFESTRRGTPLLFSSHQLDLVERLCDGLVILSHGAIAAQGTHDELRSRGEVRYKLVMDTDTGWTRDLRGVTVVDVAGQTSILHFDDNEARNQLLNEALSRGSVLELSALRPSLAEIYREATR